MVLSVVLSVLIRGTACPRYCPLGVVIRCFPLSIVHDDVRCGLTRSRKQCFVRGFEREPMTGVLLLVGLDVCLIRRTGHDERTSLLVRLHEVFPHVPSRLQVGRTEISQWSSKKKLDVNLRWGGEGTMQHGPHSARRLRCSRREGSTEGQQMSALNQVHRLTIHIPESIPTRRYLPQAMSRGSPMRAQRCRGLPFLPS